MAEAWQGYVNAVLYMTQFSRTLDDDREVERIAAYLTGHGVLNSTPHEVAGKLQSALTSGTGLTTDAIPPATRRGRGEALHRTGDRADA